MTDQPVWIRETRPNGARNLWARSSDWYVIAAGPVVGLWARSSDWYVIAAGPVVGSLPRVWFGAAGSDGPRIVADVALAYEVRQVGLPDVTPEDLAWLRGAT